MEVVGAPAVAAADSTAATLDKTYINPKFASKSSRTVATNTRVTIDPNFVGDELDKGRILVRVGLHLDRAEIHRVEHLLEVVGEVQRDRIDRLEEWPRRRRTALRLDLIEGQSVKQLPPVVEGIEGDNRWYRREH